MGPPVFGTDCNKIVAFPGIIPIYHSDVWDAVSFFVLVHIFGIIGAVTGTVTVRWEGTVTVRWGGSVIVWWGAWDIIFVCVGYYRCVFGAMM
jgi:hypothetical protein